MKSKIDLAFLGISRILQVVTLFATYRILTHSLPKDEVGFYFFLLGITGAVGLVLASPVGTYFHRMLFRWHTVGQLTKYTLNFAAFSTGLGLIAALLLSLGIHLKAFVTLDSIVATAVYAAGVTMSNMLIPALNIAGATKKFAVFSTLSPLSVLLACYLAVQYSSTASTWLLAAGLVSGVWGIIALVTLITMKIEPAAETSSDSGINGKLLTFALPLVAANVGVWFLTQGYRPFTEWRFGLESLAVIGLGITAASAVSGAFESLVYQIFLPKFYRASHEKNSNDATAVWQQMWILVIPMFFILTMCTVVFSGEFLSLIAPNTYAAAKQTMMIAALAEFFRMTGGIANLFAIGDMNTRRTAVPYLLGAGACVSLLLISSNVAWALVLGQAVATVTLIYALRGLPWRTGLLRALWPAALFSVIVLLFSLLTSGFDLWMRIIPAAAAGVCLVLVLVRQAQKWREA
jgi:O-antigen/teichoic acid export membrane protein